MATRIHRSSVWALVRAQHGVVARAQLLDLGMTPAAIRQRRLSGRLHEVHRGIYAVGRRELSRHGELVAAVLACGPEAQLSHQSAAELWRMRRRVDGPIDVAITGDTPRRRPGITAHRCGHRRRRLLHRIPVGDPTSVLIDLATCLSDDEVEDAVNEADRLDLIRTHRLRPALDEELGFVVETDSLRHHRTAAEQAVDLGRDQTHARAGLRTLRFTHSQVFHRPDHVQAVLIDAFAHR